MKVLSIRQPWAWLIVNMGKDIENRTWPTKYRGSFLIHAAKGMTKREYEDVINYLIFKKFGNIVDYLPPFDKLERGGIVGAATLVDCVTTSKSEWFFGPYGFVLEDVTALPFMPLKGMLGFFNLDTPSFKSMMGIATKTAQENKLKV